MKKISEAKRKLLVGLCLGCVCSTASAFVACGDSAKPNVTFIAQTIEYRVGENIDLFDLVVYENEVRYAFTIYDEDGKEYSIEDRTFYPSKSGTYRLVCVATKGKGKTKKESEFTVMGTMPLVVIKNEVVDMPYGFTISLDELVEIVNPDYMFLSSDSPVEMWVDKMVAYRNPYTDEGKEVDLTGAATDDGFYDGNGNLTFAEEGLFEFHYFLKNEGGQVDGWFKASAKENLNGLETIENADFNFDKATGLASWSAVEGALKYRVKVDYENVIVEGTSLNVKDYLVADFQNFDLAVIPLDANGARMGKMVIPNVIICPEKYGDMVLHKNARVNAESGETVLIGGKGTNLSWRGIKGVDNSYVAYDGEYGIGQYVAFAFKGNNLPNLCFFADEINSDMTFGGNLTDAADRNKGILLLSGFYGAFDGNTYRLAHDKDLVTFGPNRFLAGWNRLTWCQLSADLPFNMRKISDYPLLTQSGLKADGSGRTYKYVVGTYEQNGNVMMDIRLYDYHTDELIYNIHHNSGVSVGEIQAGHIIAYAAVKENSENTTFTILGKPYADQPILKQEEKVATSGATVNADGSVTLAGLTEAAANMNPGSLTLVKNSYIGFNGAYGAGTSVEFTFQGQNMPTVMLLADTINGDWSKFGGAGLLILNGAITRIDEDAHNSLDWIRVYGPNRVSSYSQEDIAFSYRLWGQEAIKPFRQGALQDGVHYKYVVEMYEKSDTIWVRLTLENLDANEKHSFEFDSKMAKGSTGNIIAYAAMKGAGVDTTFAYTEPKQSEPIPVEEEKVVTSGATENADGSVTLAGLKVAAANLNPGTLTLPSYHSNYVAFKGDYGVGTTVEFTFRGQNMPTVMLFADKINGDWSKNGGAGLLLLNGTVENASFGTNAMKRFNVYGMNRLSDVWTRITTNTGTTALSDFCLGNLEEDADYRYVVSTEMRGDAVWVVLKLTNETSNTTYTAEFEAIGATAETTGNIIAYAAMKGAGVDTTFAYTEPTCVAK